MKIVRTQQQVTSQQEYTLPELHSIFGGHGQGYSTFDIGGTSSSGGNNQNSKEMFPEFAHPAHSIPHGAHTNSHANTHTNTAAEAFHLSRTVPLTPLSLSKPDARAHNSHHTSANHHGTDPHYELQTPSHGHTAGVGAAGGSSSVRGGTNHNYSDVNIIRSSIPPAPWEVGSLYAH